VNQEEGLASKLEQSGGRKGDGYLDRKEFLDRGREMEITRVRRGGV
jgi:hypothetical protein